MHRTCPLLDTLQLMGKTVEHPLLAPHQLKTDIVLPIPETMLIKTVYCPPAKCIIVRLDKCYSSARDMSA